MPETEHSLAVFVDFENLALGFEGRRGTRFEIQKVLERLVEKGKIIVKRAYADWGRFRDYRTSLHEAAIELIEIPRRSMTGKNSADIRLVVDAMDLSYSKEHVHTFVIISGDSDFSPLVSKLKENGKHVIGLGMKNSTSDLLIDNCDEFIFYEDLDRPSTTPQQIELNNVPADKRKVMSLLMDAIVALRRENKEVIWSSMVKDTIKRKKPQFNETYYGFRTFSNLLEEGEKYGLISLTTDPRSGTYVVSESGQRPAGSAMSQPAGGGTNGGTWERRQEGRRDVEAGREERRDDRREGREGREDRWGRRRGRYGRGRYEERREGSWQNGYPARDAAAGGEASGESAGDNGASIPESHAISATGGAEFGEAPVESRDMTVEASGAAASASSGRDDYGFPTDDAPQGVSEFPEERDEMEVVLSPASGEDDDRTPEERELDARAARMAHSLEKPVSPSGKKTGGRAPRGTGAARGRRPAGPRASGAEAKASAPRRGGRPRSGGSSEGAAPAARSRRPAGAAPRRRRKSE